MSKGNPNPSPATRFSAAQQPKNGQHEKSPISQLVECQRLLMDEMRTSKGKPMARAVVARTIKEIEQLKREMRMLPRSKPVDVGPPPGRGPRQVQAVEPPSEDVPSEPKAVASPRIGELMAMTFGRCKP